MKRFNWFLLVLVVVFLTTFYTVGNAQVSDETWEKFSKNLVEAFQIPNDGLHVSVMQNIRIYDQLYPGKLNVKNAVFDIMRIYRNHKNPRMRRLALVTLYTIGDEWAIGFLKRNVGLGLESNESINKQSCCIVKNYYDKKTKVKEEDQLLAKKKK